MSLSWAMFIISATLAILGFGAEKFRIKSPKWKYAMLVGALLSAAVGFWANIETEEQIQLAHDQASEAHVQANRAQAEITEIRTPRRMKHETKLMLVAKLKPHAGQKYDIKVFRDRDSLELAQAFQAIFQEAGWLYTNVYPKYATRYAEARGDGLWIVSSRVETTRTSEARMALRRALNEAGLYDDRPAFAPVHCVEIAGPIEEGAKITAIPCSESPVQITGIGATFPDDVIPEDTLVLRIGKERP